MSATKTFILLGILSAFLVPVLWMALYPTPPLPNLDDGWWTTKIRPDTEDAVIQAFQIHVPDEVLVDLQDRLKQATRLTRPLANANFSYGFNTDALEGVLEYWQGQYDWREQEEIVNQYPHFKTQIEGLDIHFIHVKPKAIPQGVQVLPMIMLHGWPGSFIEFYKVIPLLTQPNSQHAFVFEVIIPSLPGYGFSQGAEIPGLGPIEMAQVFNKLMKRLNFDQYYVQGGDWGSLIGTNMATLYPRNVKGLHLNMAAAPKASASLKIFLGSFWPSLLVPEQYQHLVYPMMDKFEFLIRETGYLHIQATKPDTIGVALNDSPAGLAAYLLEKFSTWTNRKFMHEPDGGLTRKYKIDDLLNNVMIYWVTNSITTSMRLYAEAFSKRTFAYRLDDIPCVVPTGVAAFPEELMVHPAPVLTSKFVNLVSFNYMARGGHFAAFEEPELLAKDVWRVVKQIESIPA